LVRPTGVGSSFEASIGGAVPEAGGECAGDLTDVVEIDVSSSAT
jgi:hypothetical protein